MDRRTFIGAVAANLVGQIPLAANSQPGEKVHRIGYLQLGNPPVPAGPDWDPAPLRELGWIEGKNLVIEYHYAGESTDRLPALARELVRLNVEIIVTAGTDAAVAAKPPRPASPSSCIRPVIPWGLVSLLDFPGPGAISLAFPLSRRSSTPSALRCCAKYYHGCSV